MWWFDPSESLLRLSSYVASLNHPRDGGAGQSGGGNGYLTPKTPTYQHHCLAHVLSNQNEATADGSTEVWGGPLSGEDFVMAAVNRGGATASIHVNWTMLEVPGVTDLGALIRRAGPLGEEAARQRPARRHRRHRGERAITRHRDPPPVEAAHVASAGHGGLKVSVPA